MKRCCTCKEVKPLDQFSKSNGEKDGLDSKCKACKAAYYLAHREQRATAGADWARRNRAKSNAIKAKWAKANPDKEKERQAKWRNENPDKDRAKGRRWYWKHQEKILAVKAAWRLANPEKRRAAVTKWARANPDAYAANQHKRRARLLNAPGLFTAEDIQRIRGLQKDKCACCKRRLPSKHHRDHIIPLAKGGTNNPKNIQLLCAPCNLSKNDKCPIEFMQSRGFLL